jgi:cytochrome c peroxidase
VNAKHFFMPQRITMFAAANDPASGVATGGADRIVAKSVIAMAIAVVGLSGNSLRAQPSAPAREALRQDLGKKLFFDPRLSVDGSTSCASCHDMNHGWADGRAKATGLIHGARGKVGPRNTPTMLNAAFQKRQFVDMRASSLADQALMPLTNALEMGNASRAQVVNRLRNIPGYRRLFDQLGVELNEQAMTECLVAFESTIVSRFDAPIHRYLSGDAAALDQREARGWKVFVESNCLECHKPPLFRDDLLHNTGVSARVNNGKDRGRAAIVGAGPGDRNERAFKTASLLEAARTAPYMHDGSLVTLRDVIEHYDSGARFVAGGQIRRDPLADARVKPRRWSAEQKADLESLLTRPMMSPTYPLVQPPALP